MLDHLWPPAGGKAAAKQRLQQGRQALKRHKWLVWLLAGVLALLISWVPYLGGVGFFPLGLSLAGLIMVVTVAGWGSWACSSGRYSGEQLVVRAQSGSIG